REATVGAAQERATVELLRPPKLAGALRHVVHVALRDALEDAVRAERRRALDRVEHDGALAIRPLLRVVEREQLVAQLAAGPAVADGEHEAPQREREGQLVLGRVRL